MIGRGSMRKQEKFIMWPPYFDSTRTRGEGRRVPKNLAIPYPKISEAKAAADELHLNCEEKVDVAFPKTPWLKSGMILVDKKKSKEETIREIAGKLLKIRSATAAK
jgi:signal recognition particle subunit SRP19